MHDRPKKKWLSGKKDSKSSSANDPSTPTSRSLRWYRQISELPLNRYVDCLVNDNLAALIYTGEPTAAEMEKLWPNLANAWADIQLEYHDAMGDAEYKNYVEQLKGVQFVRVTYNSIQICIKQLADIYASEDRSPEVLKFKDIWAAEVNRLLATNFVFDLNNPEKYIANIERCRNRSKGVKINMDMKIAALEAVEKKHGEGSKADAAYFQSILITLSDAAGYHLQEDITVFEFCERVKRLRSKT